MRASAGSSISTELQTLPETTERAHRKLFLYVTLAESLEAAQGFAAPEVIRAYTRVHQLCQQVGEIPRLFFVLVGLRRYYAFAGELQTAQALAEQLRQHRLKGVLLMAQYPDSTAEAEAFFHQALAIARRQQAGSWELRAAMSLSRLWQQHGKRADARQLLAEIYSSFTEGFATGDLREAKALLDALAS